MLFQGGTQGGQWSNEGDGYQQNLALYENMMSLDGKNLSPPPSSLRRRARQLS